MKPYSISCHTLPPAPLFNAPAPNPIIVFVPGAACVFGDVDENVKVPPTEADIVSVARAMPVYHPVAVAVTVSPLTEQPTHVLASHVTPIVLSVSVDTNVKFGSVTALPITPVVTVPVPDTVISLPDVSGKVGVGKDVTPSYIFTQSTVYDCVAILKLDAPDWTVSKPVTLPLIVKEFDETGVPCAI